MMAGWAGGTCARGKEWRYRETRTQFGNPESRGKWGSVFAKASAFAEATASNFLSGSERKLEARAGIEPAIELLQSSALPLGYRAD